MPNCCGCGTLWKRSHSRPCRNATIKEKNEKPEIKKEVQTSIGDWGDKNNAKIGDTVEYKVEIKVADGAQTYTVTDTMSKGLTFNSGSLKVTANGAQTANYTLTPTENGFTLELLNPTSALSLRVPLSL